MFGLRVVTRLEETEPTTCRTWLLQALQELDDEGYISIKPGYKMEDLENEATDKAYSVTAWPARRAGFKASAIKRRSPSPSARHLYRQMRTVRAPPSINNTRST